MNKVLLIGRLTRDPDVRYSSENNDKAVAKYTLAVDRRFKREGDDTLTLSELRHLVKEQNSRKSIFTRE